MCVISSHLPEAHIGFRSILLTSSDCLSRQLEQRWKSCGLALDDPVIVDHLISVMRSEGEPQGRNS
jgi:hypothetical protein